MLSATNTGTRPCVLDGYPQLDIHVGKAQGASSKPKGTAAAPPRHVLDPGRTAAYPVFYDPYESSPGTCFMPADSHASVYVSPPHPVPPDYGTPSELTDAKGRPLDPQVCGDSIEMGPPLVG
ncbi:DUF4232 domain-containing protein [Streptomyces sp. NPDC053493]|uniref:DUF4232 domain-containing protein n=1 Tax=Streptomyces sp. NPDC053493 TaxID=3365705 RepID=UPI0037CF1AFB